MQLPKRAETPQIDMPIHVEQRALTTEHADSERGERLRARYRRVERNLLRQGKLIESTPAETAPISAESLADNFIAIAFYQEYASDGTRLSGGADAETTLHRWQAPIRVALKFGSSVRERRRTRDTRLVGNYMKRLADLTGLDIQFAGPFDANFYILVAAEPDRAALVNRRRADLSEGARASLISLDPRNFCAVATAGNRTSGVISSAVALIRNENPPLSRRSCFHEELAQALGLSNDSPTARPSIFNDDDEFALLTKHDEYLLQILYDPRLKPGMTRSQAAPIVTEIARELMGQTHSQQGGSHGHS